MCLAEGSPMGYPNLRPGVLNLGRLVGPPRGGLKFGGVIFGFLISSDNALTLQSTAHTRHASFRKLGYLPCAENEISLRALPSYKYSPISDVELKVRSMIEESRAQENEPQPPPAAPLLDKAPAVQPSIRPFFGQQ